ncbi:MAG: hypothetical protein WHV67_10090 [Thermoanaerobaculia bacterium]
MIFFLILSIFNISKISFEEEKIILHTSLELERSFIGEGIYNLKGNLIHKNKKMGEVKRFSRIYFPCKKNLCSYPFHIEIETKNIKREDFLNFLKGKDIKLELIFKEINKNEEIKILKDFSYNLNIEKETELEMDIIKIEEIKVSLKEKPQINFNLILKNPFNFKLKVKNIKVLFLIENQKLEEDFKIEEEIGKGDRVFPLKIPLKGDLLIYILTKKFLEEDLSLKISAGWSGEITVEIDKITLKIPFEK